MRITITFIFVLIGLCLIACQSNERVDAEVIPHEVEIAIRDTVSIGNAFDLQKSIRSNRTIVLSADTLYLEEALNIKGVSDLHIMGNGAHIMMASNDLNVVRILNCTHLTLSDLTFVSKSIFEADQEPGALFLKSSESVELIQVQIKGRSGIGLFAQEIANLKIKDTKITQCEMLIFELQNCRDVLIERSEFYNNKLGVSVMGAFTNETKDVQFDRCTFKDNLPKMMGNPAFNFMDNYKNTEDKIVFSNCVFSGNVGYKWYMEKIDLIDCEMDGGINE